MLFRRNNKYKNNTISLKQVGQLLKHLGMIAQQVDQGIAIIDLNATIHFVNTPWAKMHGYNTSNELLGKHISIFHTQQQVQAELNPLIEETRCIGWSDCIIENSRSDGAAFLAHMKMTALKDVKGKTIGYTVFTTDITGRKHLEDTVIEAAKLRAELKEQIEQLQYNIHEHEQTEKNIKEQADEQTAANDKLKQQIADYKIAENSFKQQINEFKASNENLKDQINESEQARKKITEQLNELKDSFNVMQDKLTGFANEQEISKANNENIDPAAMPIQPFNGEKIKAIVDLVNRLR